MAGRHRRRRAEPWRRWLLGALTGGILSMGGFLVVAGGLDGAGAITAPALPATAMLSLAVPSIPTAAPATTTVASPTPSLSTTTSATTTKPKPLITQQLPLTSSCSSVGWGVKPAVARVGHHLAEVFGLKIAGILGLGGRVTAGSDHPKGLALDLMVYADTALGNRIADYVLAHRVEWGVTYVIWRQRINTGTGWVAMEDRGSITANHYDHVHISFSPSSTANPPC